MPDDFSTSWKRLQDVLNRRIATLGREHPETLMTMDSIALLLRGQGRVDQANEWEARAAGLRAQTAIKADPKAYKASFNEFLRISAALLDATKTQSADGKTRGMNDLAALLKGSHLMGLMALRDEDIDSSLVEGRTLVRQLLAAMLR